MSENRKPGYAPASETEIATRIASDPDAPEASDEQLAAARPFAEAFPELMESIVRARGRPRSASARQQISIRLDPDVIEKFRATGKGWQGRINDALRKAKV